MSKPEHTPRPWTIRQIPTHINEVAAWMMTQGYATGHGDSIEDLLKELDWQIREREREACANVCESEGVRVDASWASCAAAIRARGEQ